MIDYSERAQDIYNSIIRNMSKKNMSEAEVTYQGGKTYRGYVFKLEDMLSQHYPELVGPNAVHMCSLLILSDDTLNKGSGSYVPDSNIIILNTNVYLEDFQDVKETVIKHKQSLIHEFIHAQIYNKSGGKNVSNYKSGDLSNINSYIDYGNQPEEFNAYLVTSINAAVNHLNDMKYPDSLIATFDDFLELLERFFTFNKDLLTPQNKKRFISKAYSTWEILKEKYIGDRYDERYNAVKIGLEKSYDGIVKTYGTEDSIIQFYLDYMDIPDEKQAFFESLGVRNKLIQGKNKQVLYDLAEKYWDRFQKEGPQS